FGFALECVHCESTPPGRQGGPGRGAFAVWHYSEFPRVVEVAPSGAAARAGVQVGDYLESIDGLSLLTDEGGRRLSSVRVGDEVKLQLGRGARIIDVTLSLGRLGRGRGRGDTPSDGFVPGFPADYSAHVGGAALEIW